MAEEPFQVDPLVIIAALLEVAGGEVTVPEKYLTTDKFIGRGLELQDRTGSDGVFIFKLTEGEE